MSFLDVMVHGFRNLENTSTEISDKRILIVGENGQGKSNFLESLYYSSFGASFRGTDEAMIVKEGTEQFRIAVHFNSTLVDSMHDSVEVRWLPRKKEYWAHEKKLASRNDLIRIHPSIIFCHEDFFIATGEHEKRRHYFDQTASLVSPEYLEILRQYKRIIRHRNKCLKMRETRVLSALDEQLSKSGIMLSHMRQKLESDLSGRIGRYFGEIMDTTKELVLKYQPSWNVGESADSIAQKLRNLREKELALGVTLSGPHRDKWIFTLGDGDIADTASTGQKRLVAIILRLLQAEYYTSISAKNPVLLFDDVFLEMDPQKRRRFLDIIPHNAQTFFALLPGEDLGIYDSEGLKVLAMNAGKLTNV